MVTLSVSQLNAYIKAVIDEDRKLKSIYVCGEISNFTNHYQSGHLYLTLKDNKSSIKAIMFRSSALKLKFTPSNGMKVIARGRISVFERDGLYQLYIEDMQPDGLGALYLAYQQLKEKLSKEGLFDDSSKKKIPEIPSKVGVITSPTGAAVRDIFNVLGRRFPLAEVVFYPAKVQGDMAAESLIEGLRTFAELNAADVIIIGRGGGSLEDLWAFNNEELARTIVKSPIPIISAVGHETDYTICDFAADLRAPTPSAAAELAVPDYTEQISKVASIKYTMVSYLNFKIKSEMEKLNSIKNKSVLKSPLSMLDEKKVVLDAYEMSLINLFKDRINKERLSFAENCAKLDALSPLKSLERGYSIVYKNGELIKTYEQAKIGDKLNIDLGKGSLTCHVSEVYEDSSIERLRRKAE